MIFLTMPGKLDELKKDETKKAKHFTKHSIWWVYNCNYRISNHFRYQVKEFQKFLEGPLLDGLYWNTWYSENSTSIHKNSSHIYYENLLLGVPQIRQLKIRNNTCSIYPSFRAFMKGCYGQYHYINEDKKSFGFMNDTEKQIIMAHLEDFTDAYLLWVFNIFPEFLLLQYFLSALAFMGMEIEKGSIPFKNLNL
ncbi:Polycystic kidney disease 2-like 2 protein [Varanus komodoensis]|nr:Polycystic kidney disease 2-like 2 protein [Varanus komodoensis]